MPQRSVLTKRCPPTPETLIRTDGATLAVERVAPHGNNGPGVVFLHGLMSDRKGTKAEALLDHCASRGYGFVRFDMFGHGQSSGRFEGGTISRWVDDALAILDHLTTGPQILVGSSMGGWVMLKAALARPARIAGLIGIAAAPDFTEDMMWAGFSADQRRELEEKGLVHVQGDCDTRPYPISRALIEDGRANMVLRDAIALQCPLRLLQGQRDISVPWQTALRLAEKVGSDDVDVVLIKDGDHRLSRPQDLARLCGELDALVKQVTV